MRKHKKEIERFANTEYGTKVWHKANGRTRWVNMANPTWEEDDAYIVDDEYAQLRIASIGEDIPIQVYNHSHSKWEIPTYKLQFDADRKNYRLKPKEEEFKYPIYKKDKGMGFVVKFTDFTIGEVVAVEPNSMTKVGHGGNCWSPHTNQRVWEDCDYVETIYYYQWEKLTMNRSILTSSHITDKYAEENNFENSGWRKIESSKRTWEY